VTSPVRFKRRLPAGDAPVYRLYEMFEWEVTFDEATFHLSKLPDADRHNAYDADHKGVLFRADAIFRHDEGEYTLPIFATRDDKGDWRWLVRFRPYHSGDWTVSAYVLHWHPQAHAAGEPSDSRRTIRYGADRRDYYEHVHGPAEVLHFTVTDTPVAEQAGRPVYLEGPLERPGAGDNPNYFYRRGADGTRRAEFVLGAARPWVTRRGPDPTGARHWDSFLERGSELFKPLADAGCNALYHWFAPNETNLVHQAGDEYWFEPPAGARGGFMHAIKRGKADRPANRGAAWPGAPLSGAAEEQAYKCYDQGRAAHTDRIFGQARVGHRTVQLFVVVTPHDLLQTGSKRDRNPRNSHPWGEWGWSEQHPKRQAEQAGRRKDIPSQLNGFHFFRPVPATRLGPDPARGRLTLEQFFQMSPSGARQWQVRLFKHYANYWRYIVGRWTAYPALGAWVLMDELEGVGTGVTWWWEKKHLTYPWHDLLVRLIRGRVPWHRVGTRDLYYTGDPLAHPFTSSTTHYRGTDPDLYRRLPESSRLFSPIERRALDEFRRTGSAAAALQIIETLGELPRRADWRYGTERSCAVDFASHHAYQAIPSWGHWGTCTVAGHAHRGRWTYLDNRDHPLPRVPPHRLGLPNETHPIFQNPDRWFWDSLCVRLGNWSAEVVRAAARDGIGALRLVTEFGCVERNAPGEAWDRYGKRVPGMTHFACWAALMQGHAGAPFKWNDGGAHGEMQWRTTAGRESPDWKRTVYPVDNYRELTKVAAYVKSLQPFDLGRLTDAPPMQVVGPGGVDPNFRVWGRADRGRTGIIAWLYDRTFSSRGQRLNRSLKVQVASRDTSGKLVMAPAYTYEWYDTWKGGAHAPAQPATPDSQGWLSIPLPPLLPRSNDQAVKDVADGNDIAIIIRVSRAATP
jgi:hypothetical protein